MLFIGHLNAKIHLVIFCTGFMFGLIVKELYTHQFTNDISDVYNNILPCGDIDNNIQEISSLSRQLFKKQEMLKLIVHNFNTRRLDNCQGNHDGLKIISTNIENTLVILNNTTQIVQQKLSELIDSQSKLIQYDDNSSDKPCTNLTNDYGVFWNCTTEDCIGTTTKCRSMLDFSDISIPLIDIKRFKRITFIGDSWTKRLYLTLEPRLYAGLKKVRVIKQSGRCANGKYLSNNFTHPKIKRTEIFGVGPNVYGRSHPGCTDCSGCDTVCNKGIRNNTEVIFEYITLEYPKDISLQTDEIETTQILMNQYFIENKPDLLYISVGTHTIILLNKLNDIDTTNKMVPLYKSQLREMLTMYRTTLPSATIVFGIQANSFDHGVNTILDALFDNIDDIIHDLNIKILDGRKLTTSLISSKETATKLYTDLMHPYGNYFTLFGSILISKII